MLISDIFTPSTFAVRLSGFVWIALFPQIMAPIYAISTEIFMQNISIWYSTGSYSGDLPNERKISDWLHKFHVEIAVHPSVARVAQLMIGKFIQNPPSSLQTCLKYT